MNIKASKMKREVSWNASWAWTGVRIPWPRPPRGQNDPRPAPSPCNTTFLILKSEGISTWMEVGPPRLVQRDKPHWSPFAHIPYTSSCCISAEDSSQWRAQEDVWVWTERTPVWLILLDHSEKLCTSGIHKRIRLKNRGAKRSWS